MRLRLFRRSNNARRSGKHEVRSQLEDLRVQVRALGRRNDALEESRDHLEARLKQSLADLREIFQAAAHAARIGAGEDEVEDSLVARSDATLEVYALAPDVESDPVSAINRASRDPPRAATGAAIAREPYDPELDITTGGGEDRWIRMIRLADMVGGRCRRLYVTVQDIDARIRAQQARLVQVRTDAAHRLKAQCLAQISQELRTPLNAVLGIAQLLATDRDEPPSPIQKSRILKIERAGTQLLQLIDDVIGVPARSS